MEIWEILTTNENWRIWMPILLMAITFCFGLLINKMGDTEERRNEDKWIEELERERELEENK